jgi:hypothetical protein
LKNEKKLEAGSEIDSRCLKCKDVTNHTIIAMVDGEIGKVTCNVCKARHKYRPPQPEKVVGAKKKPTKRATAAATAKLAKIEAHYQELVAGRDEAVALAYSMTDTFKRNDLINHPMFGLGVVSEIVMPNKIEVVFRLETKLMLCGRLQVKY